MTFCFQVRRVPNSALPKPKEDPVKLSAAKPLKVFGGRWLCDFWHVTQKGFKELSNIVMTKLVS